MFKVLVVLALGMSSLAKAEEVITLQPMTMTATSQEETPALPPDQIIEQLPGAPEWMVKALNKFPVAILLISLYLAGLGFFRSLAEALLWYSRTTESKSDDALAAKLGKYAKMAAAPIALLGWGAPKKSEKKEA